MEPNPGREGLVAVGTLNAERIRVDAASLYREGPLPATFAFFDELTPHHQRLFAVELWEALSKVAIGGTTADLAALVELVEGWQATAAVDNDEELAAQLKTEATYRPLEVA